MIRQLSLIALASLGLAGCGGTAPQGPAPQGNAPRGAAESASRLLTAAYRGDRVAFEAQIDRPAVREDVRRQVTRLAQATTLDVDGGPSEFALDRMISPQAFRLVHAGTGKALTSAPTARQVAPLMRTLDARHACLLDAASPKHCLLTFAKDKDRWRLVGMRAMGLRIELADART